MVKVKAWCPPSTDKRCPKRCPLEEMTWLMNIYLSNVAEEKYQGKNCGSAGDTLADAEWLGETDREYPFGYEIAPGEGVKRSYA